MALTRTKRCKYPASFKSKTQSPLVSPWARPMGQLEHGGEPEQEVARRCRLGDMPGPLVSLEGAILLRLVPVTIMLTSPAMNGASLMSSRELLELNVLT